MDGEKWSLVILYSCQYFLYFLQSLLYNNLCPVCLFLKNSSCPGLPILLVAVLVPASCGLHFCDVPVPVLASLSWATLEVCPVDCEFAVVMQAVFFVLWSLASVYLLNKVGFGPVIECNTLSVVSFGVFVLPINVFFYEFFRYFRTFVFLFWGLPL